MSEEIDKHVLRKYEVQQRLGKGVSAAAVVAPPLPAARRLVRRAAVEISSGPAVPAAC